MTTSSSPANPPQPLDGAPPVTHPRLTLMREGWRCTQWLRAALVRPVEEVRLQVQPKDTEALARAAAAATNFELQLENSEHLDHDQDGQRIRVAQELVWARQSIGRDGLGSTPRTLWLDLLERAEELFGDAHGMVEVATPAIEPPMTAEEHRTLRWTLGAAAAVLFAVLMLVLNRGNVNLWAVAAGAVAAGLAVAGCLTALLPAPHASESPKENALETEVSRASK